uniref:Uncharacterized protein n=1 Tax=Moumouvirus sp. 'Monve' TaxID=1128131 RepID=H2ECY3_9VIRU|nr:hypothetical protein mv_L51 [Moumouvirus Monve]
MLGDFISQDLNHNFLHYLNHSDNGSKYNLTNQLVALEKLWDIPCGNLYLFTKMYENRIWEIPTNELCEGLIRIFDCLKINKINELAAGNGLLSARLKHYAKKLDYELKISTSDGTNKIFGSHPFTFTKVKDLNIRDFNKSEPIVISWIHSKFEDELLSVVEEYKNEYVFLIGEEPDKEDYSNNQSYLFDRKMFTYGYSKITFEFKQVSQMDYYLHDFIRSDIYNENKTCVTLYYHSSKISDVWFIKDLLMKDYPQLFGIYLRKNKEYYNQDLSLINISNKKIEEYALNNYKDLNPLLAKGLKNYMLIKSRQNISKSFQSYPSSSHLLPSYLDSNSRIKMLASMTLAFTMSALMEKAFGPSFETDYEFKPILPKRDITQEVAKCTRYRHNDLHKNSPMTVSMVSTCTGKNAYTFDKTLWDKICKIADKKYSEYKLDTGKTSEPLLILPKRRDSYFSVEKEFIDKPFGPIISDLIQRKNHVIPKKLANKICPTRNNKKFFNDKKNFVCKQPLMRSRNH